MGQNGINTVLIYKFSKNKNLNFNKMATEKVEKKSKKVYAIHLFIHLARISRCHALYWVFGGCNVKMDPCFLKKFAHFENSKYVPEQKRPNDLGVSEALDHRLAP